MGVIRKLLFLGYVDDLIIKYEINLSLPLYFL